MGKSKQEIMEEVLAKKPKNYDIETDEILECMDIWAKEQSISFFKWYGSKMTVFIEYIKDIRPSVTSNEIEEKIKEFEGKSLEDLYKLFTESNTKQP